MLRTSLGLYKSFALWSACFIALLVLGISDAKAVPLPDPLPRVGDGQGLLETRTAPTTPEQYLPENPAENLARLFPSRDIQLIFGSSKNSQENFYFVMLQEYVNGMHRPYSITVSHMPGRGGAYAPNALLQKPADGYSLAAVTLPSFLWQMQLRDRLYTEDDITLLTVGAKAPLALWVQEDAPWQTMQEFIDHIRTLPASNAFFCGTGSYSSHHMTHLMFGRASGLTVGYLPLLGDMEGAQMVRSGKALGLWALGVPVAGMRGMRPLAVTGDDRRPLLPETPTFKELGYSVEVWQFFGLSISGKTPAVLENKVHQFIAELLSSSDFTARVTAAGFDVLADTQTEDVVKEQANLLQNFLNEYEMVLP